MAFGTGGHETTRLCLELLEQIMDNMPTLLSPAVLDLGKGRVFWPWLLSSWSRTGLCR